MNERNENDKRHQQPSGEEEPKVKIEGAMHEPTTDETKMNDTILKMDIPPEVRAKLDQNKLEADAQPQELDVPQADIQTTAEISTCPRCKTPRQKSDQVCPRCGMVFGDVAKTRLLHPEEETQINRNRSMMGGGLFMDQNPIVFEIDGKTLTLPVAEVTVIGRSSGDSTEGEPDVSLNDYNAGKRGVSRRHMALRRKGSLIYVADLGSTNGTYLNGRRLQRNEERILRDGDEIHLSHLLIRVSLPKTTEADS